MHLVLFFILALLLTAYSFPFGKKKEEDGVVSGEDAVLLGLKTMTEQVKDPRLMRETMELMKDPKMMEDVKKLMKDPKFLSEMERIKSDPIFRNTLETAKAMYGDASKAAAMYAELSQREVGISGDGEPLSDVQLGMAEMAKAAKNPKLLADALEMMKDPEIAKEVQEMMKDPKFQAEMKRYTDTPQFKTAMSKATEEMESLKSDPVKMKQAEQKLADMMKA